MSAELTKIARQVSRAFDLNEYRKAGVKYGGHMENKQYLIRLHINCTGFYRVEGHDHSVQQILFDGFTEGLVSGKILPGGVDTQTIYKDGTGFLSARYIIEGTDSEGKNCKLYVDNRADFGTDKTEPHIITDSEALAWLENAKLQGWLREEAGQLLIDIYEI